MAVALQRHQLVDVHRAEAGDPPDVVAGQVDQHHVLGDLLRVLLQLAGHAPVVVVGAAAAAGAGDRAGDHLAVDQLHQRLGRRADDRDLGVAQEVHVRAGVHLAQHAVHVERVGVEVEVEALRQHDLEDVAGQDVLLGHLDRRLVLAGGHAGAHLGQRLAGVGRLDGDVRQRLAELHGHGLDPAGGLVVGDVEVGAGAAEHGHALDERHPLAPVVEGGQAPDHAHHGVGQVEVVAGHVGQVLHLAHDVVAEVAHDAALVAAADRGCRASGTRGAAPRGRPACPGRAAPTAGSVPSTVMRPSRSTNVADGSRPTNENRLQRSPCSTDSSRKPVPSPTSLA